MNVTDTGVERRSASGRHHDGRRQRCQADGRPTAGHAQHVRAESAHPGEPGAGAEPLPAAGERGAQAQTVPAAAAVRRTDGATGAVLAARPALPPTAAAARQPHQRQLY